MNEQAPAKFIITTEMATLKGDDSGVITLNIPGGFIIEAGQSITYESFMNIGTINAPFRSRMTTSRGGFWTPGSSLLTNVLIQRSSSQPPAEEPHSAMLERVSPTTIRLWLRIINFNSSDGIAVLPQSAQTIQAKIDTYLSPFN